VKVVEQQVIAVRYPPGSDCTGYQCSDDGKLQEAEIPSNVSKRGRDDNS
jgi:hypothetical protein